MQLLNKINISRLAQHRLVKQTSLLFSSEFIATILGIFTGMINTRALGKEGYGQIAFIYSVINITSLIFNFGLFNAGSRCLAKAGNDSDEEREIVGALLLAFGVIMFVFCGLIFSFGFFIDQIFHSQVNHVFLLVPILAIAYPLEQLLYQICQGTNKIGQMAFFKIFPRTAYLIIALGVVFWSELTVSISVILNLGNILLAGLFTAYQFKPSFRNLRHHWTHLWEETKSYGFHVYLGRVSSLATYDSTKLLVAYFSDTTMTGFYNLAVLLSSPMVMLSRALSISLFKSFLPEKKVSQKVTQFNLGWLVACTLFLILAGKFIITTLYTAEYAPTYPLLIILSIATLFRGLIQPYNLFMGAKGCGKQLRNTAFILTFSILAFNLALIPFLGSTGAALASLCALFVNYWAHLFYYRKVLRLGLV